MPIYRYRCEDCQLVFTALEFAGDPATARCTRCDSTHIERIPSVPGVQFKGKGFYVTDRNRSRSSATNTTKSGDAKGTPKKGTPQNGKGTASDKPAPDKSKAATP